MLPTIAIVIAAVLLFAQLALALPAAHLDIHVQHAHVRFHSQLVQRSHIAKGAERRSVRRRRCLAVLNPTSSELANPSQTTSTSFSATVDAPSTTLDAGTTLTRPTATDKTTESRSSTKSRLSSSSKPPAPSPSDDPEPQPTSVVPSSLRKLFPAGAPSSLSWSTNKKAPNTIDFSMSALGATNVMKLPHDITHAPDGSQAMEVSFKKGAYDYQGPAGGFSFVAYGPDDVDLTVAREATFAYSIYFQDGFQFKKGGKLPGLIGGDNDNASKQCNGGHKATNCFSARMMFRAKGKGELYAYLPPGLKGNDGICDIPPESHCNPNYGSSLGRGAFNWKTGGWTTMAQRVRLNDVGRNNGEIEVFIDGKSVIHASGLTLRQNGKGRIRAAHIQSFFGGHDATWASPIDQKFWLKDFAIAITEKL